MLRHVLCTVTAGLGKVTLNVEKAAVTMRDT